MEYKNLYTENYYNQYCMGDETVSYKDSVKLEKFMASVADHIVKTLHPATVLDVGCAMGFLVAALRDLGVEAYGIDVSKYAVSHVREDIKPYCKACSALDPLPDNFPKRYDLLTNIEVAEHLYEEDGKKLIQNICGYSDRILFSSTPDDFQEKTHFNVQQPEYWAKRFAMNAFYRDLTTDVSFISPQAVLFCRRDLPPVRLVEDYERKLRMQIAEKDKLKGKLYYDGGNGLNEKDTLVIDENNLIPTVKRISLPVKTDTLRFDPLEAPCIVRDFRAEIGSEEDQTGAMRIRHNGTAIGRDLFFSTSDPNLFLLFEHPISGWLKLYFSVLPVFDGDFCKTMEKLSSDHEKDADELKKMQDRLSEADDRLKKDQVQHADKLKELQEELSRTEDVLQTAQTQHMSRQEEMRSKLSETECSLQTVKDQLEELQRENSDLKEQSCSISRAYQAIISSTIWRVTKPLRRLLDFFKRSAATKQESDIVKQVEVFRFENNILEIRGWIFARSGILERRKLKVISQGQAYFLDLASGLQREDVARAFECDFALKSGFEAGASIENCDRFSVYFQYTLNDMDGEEYLGEYHTLFVNKIKFLTHKLNRQTLRKGLNAVRDRRLYSVLSSASRPRVCALNRALSHAVDLPAWIEKNFSVDPPDFPDEVLQCGVDLIVPVYNGYQYLDAFFASVQKTKMPYRLIIIDDKSSDERVYPYLKHLAERDDRMVLLRNPENLGFVKTVNRGLNMAKGHVALLNTDIEMPPMWLERLMSPIILNPEVASSTPFTNSGTLCSFPEIGKNNSIYQNLSCEEIDAHFAHLVPSYTQLPTGVGFCMGMSRGAIRKIGLLDTDTFGKGYGEENDWCQRAIRAGFCNVQVENLYVYHKHGGSFPNAEKQTLMAEHAVLVAERYPNYNADVARFFEMDPAKQTRDMLEMLITARMDEHLPVYILDHAIGGGASSFLKDFIGRRLADGDKVVLIRYYADRRIYLLTYCFAKREICCLFSKFSDLLPIIRLLGIGELYVNELVTYPKLFEALQFLLNLKEKYRFKLNFFLHDYYAICPSINLLNTKKEFCGIPSDGEACDRCLKSNEMNNYPACTGMAEWRSNWLRFFRQCDSIIAFSESSAVLLRRAYGELEGIQIEPHQVDDIVNPKKRYKTTDTLNIGLLGILTEHKGSQIVEQMLERIDTEHSEARVVLIGTSQQDIASPSFSQTGKYTRAELPKLALEQDIDIFLIPSVWPETFSFTTEEAIRMGFPVASFDIGAPSERVSRYEKGLILSRMEGGDALREMQSYINDRLLPRNPIFHSKKILFIADYISFASRYRVEHFREQLLLCGVRSDFYQADQLPAQEFHFADYHALVVYRCKLTRKVDNFIYRSRDAGLEIFYDIDDFVFDYRSIRSLPFLREEEYTDFESQCEKIRACMEKCDAYLTSTDSLKDQIAAAFPGKSVLVHRNVASMEMVSLSLRARQAQEMRKAHSGTVVLGYFSGSRTHDGDFAVIQPVLLGLLEKYEFVRLLIGGCLNLDDTFRPYEERIQKFEFMDWRGLPAKIASIDINLMPLEHSVFHACKSENKWIEAGLVQVPTVASYNEELARCIRPGTDGLLCRTAEEWRNTLAKLIEDRETREKIGRAAFQRVLESCSTLGTREQAAEIFCGESEDCATIMN